MRHRWEYARAAYSGGGQAPALLYATALGLVPRLWNETRRAGVYTTSTLRLAWDRVVHILGRHKSLFPSEAENPWMQEKTPRNSATSPPTSCGGTTTASPEANITSAVRDFLINSGLVRGEDVHEENPPSQGSRQAVDLRALDTFIEFKQRIGPSGITPNPDHVEQLDEYLAQSAAAGRGVRLGILTDGKHWLLRWPGAGAVRTAPPYAFTLDSRDSGADLYKWLRDEALAATEQTQPDRPSIKARFGPDSLLYQRDIDTLRQLYQATAKSETIAVKRRLWHNLLMAALGEIARGSDQMDDLFVRHTYLSMTVGMVVQASFGIDIAAVAESEPSALLNGRRFHNATGLHGIVESDFFAWPAEVEGGLSLVKTLARRVARFVWSNAPADVGAILYETVIPPDERRQLGEYYTPDWLARVMVRELVEDPLNQRVLDPACGSGTFLVEAVAHFLEAAQQAKLTPLRQL